MNCIYCNSPVYGHNGLTVPSEGAAHQQCFQMDQALKRTFQHLEISKLSDGELHDLKDLVLTELNDRERSGEDDSDIELF